MSMAGNAVPYRAVLAKPAEEALENFQTTFNESQPAGSLSKLLELLALILCWDPNVNEILIPLRGWIEVLRCPQSS